MTAIFRRSFPSFALLAAFAAAQGCSAPRGAAEGAAPAATQGGAYVTGHYPDLFVELLGVSPAEVDAKVERAWSQLFHGDDATQRVYYPVEPDMAYILDVLHGDVRSEGMSYGMMIAVQLDRKEEFDRIWNWATTHMRHGPGPHRDFFAWQVRPDGTILDRNSASDGEVWFATALFLASNRWGDGTGIYDYRREAQRLLDAMLYREDDPENDGSVTNMFNREVRQVVFVPEAGLAASITDPSYHVPHFFELWARWAERDNPFWCDVAVTSREFLKQATHPATGLTAEYTHFDGTPIAPPWNPGADKFHYDSFRVGANIAMDHVWFAPDPWHVQQNDRLLSFFASHGLDEYPNNYTIDGRPLTTSRSAGLVAANGAAALAATTPVRTEFVRRLWEMPIPDGAARYYDGMLYMLSLLKASGNFRIYHPAAGPVAGC
jgi:oligosaccharide reducing-end xylanase